MSNILEFRTIIVGGPGINNKLLLPKVEKVDKNGYTIFTKTGVAQTEYASSPDVVTQQPTMDWATRQQDLDELDKETKDTINEIKTLLRQCEAAAVVYHAGGDPCSLCSSNHYHLVVSRDTRKEWDKDYRWRRIRQAAKGFADKPTVTVTSQLVKNLPGLINYLCKAPRRWYGTNSKTIDMLRRKSIADHSLTSDYDRSCAVDESIDAFLGASAEDPENDPWGPKDTITDGSFSIPAARKRRPADWGGEFEVESVNHEKKKKSPWGEASDGEEGEQVNYNDRLIRIVIHIMKECRTSDKTLLRMIAERAVKSNYPEAHNWVARLKNVNFNKQENRIYATAANEYRHYVANASLRDLLANAWRSMALPRDATYISIEKSLDLLFEWFTCLNCKPAVFIENLAKLLNNQSGKKNCMFLWGSSNAGKSVMFAHPIEYIMQSVGRIVALNTNQNFIFEGCMNRRLISIEECTIPKQHVEEIKKLFGGESCQVAVKYAKEGGIVMRTPCIATSNGEPWRLVVEDKDPIENRCHLYHIAAPFRQLEDYAGEALDPRAYILLLNLWNDGRSLTDCFGEDALSQLISELDDKYSEISPEAPGNYALFSKCAQPKWSAKHIDGYIDGLPVINPYHLTVKELDSFIPGFKHWDITEDILCPVYDKFKVISRYEDCWLGVYVGIGNKEPSKKEGESFCSSCGLFHRPETSNFINWLQQLNEQGDPKGTSTPPDLRSSSRILEEFSTDFDHLWLQNFPPVEDQSIPNIGGEHFDLHVSLVPTEDYLK